MIPPAIDTWLRQQLAQLPLKVHLNFWEQAAVGNATTDAAAIALHIRHPGVLRHLLLSQDPLVLADDFLQGWIDVDGDLALGLPLIQQHPQPPINRFQALRAWLAAWRLPSLPAAPPQTTPWQKLPQRSRDRDRLAVQHHYDAGNDFYQRWLDPYMVYSCAYFEQPHMSLEEAQAAKLDRICRKLQLAPADTLLDIGCGWGALMHWAATHYGVKAHGITLSAEQLAYNQRRIEAAGLTARLTVELLDYRDLAALPRFDKIVSIGMIEHVGEPNYPLYFERALAALKPGGLFLNHGIATRDRWNHNRLGERFIDRYIFPDGHLTLLSTQLAAAEAAGWEIVDVDAWRPHYARTLHCWAENFERVRDEVVQLLGERWVQLWRLYLIGCALGFENNQMGVYQTLLRRQADRTWNLPLTRDAWLC